MQTMTNEQQTAAIIDLQTRVGTLEGKQAPPPPGDDYDKYSNDFYWDATGRWLDVTIPAGTTAKRNVVPVAGWAGQLEFAAGALAENQTDRIRCVVKGVGGAVLYDDGGWANLAGYHARVNANGPATLEITSEKDGHISVNCLHQP